MAPVTADKLAKNLELINQLLAKAESSPYPAEAQAFQEHAERLMVRHGIDKAQLDADAGKRGKPREKMVEESYTVSGVYRAAHVRGLNAVASAFNNIELLGSNYRNTSTLYLIGAESDVAQMIRLFNSLQMQVQTAVTAWWLTVPHKHYMDRPSKQADKRQFHLAFYVTVASRLAAIYGEESTGAELVLADRKGRATEHMEGLYPDLRTARNTKLRAGSRDAAIAGVRAGEAADINGEKIGSEAKTSLAV